MIFTWIVKITQIEIFGTFLKKNPKYNHTSWEFGAIKKILRANVVICASNYRHPRILLFHRPHFFPISALITFPRRKRNMLGLWLCKGCRNIFSWIYDKENCWCRTCASHPETRRFKNFDDLEGFDWITHHIPPIVPVAYPRRLRVGENDGVKRTVQVAIG